MYWYKQNNGQETFGILIKEDYYLLASDSISLSIEKIDNSVNVLFQTDGFKYMKMDNRFLNVSYKWSGGAELRDKIGDIDTLDREKLLSNFSGVIMGYPYYKLSVVYGDEKDPIICDLIDIRRQYYEHPSNGMRLLSIEPDGSSEVVKEVKQEEMPITIRIGLTNYVGQICGDTLPYSMLHSPNILVEIAYQQKYNINSYHPPYDWSKGIDNVKRDSSFKEMELSIDFKGRIAFFKFVETLSSRTYTIRSNSSLDPGDDIGEDVKSRMIWALAIIDELYIIRLIIELQKFAKLSALPYLRYLNEVVVRIEFYNEISKSEFKEMFGIQLLELVSEHSYRY